MKLAAGNDMVVKIETAITTRSISMSIIVMIALLSFSTVHRLRKRLLQKMRLG